MPYLNYHHLRYFRAIAQEGNLTRAAQHLSISPSALSTQLAQLEENLGHALFNRSKKRLILTEAGHLALDYAETIFKTGEELFDALQHRVPKQRQVLRIGAVATLSRNFQLEIIKPVLKKREIELVLRTSPLSDLLNMLEAHTIDLVLSNLPVPADAQNGLRSHLISQQQVILVGHRPNKKFHFPESLHGTDMVLPSFESNIRVGFDLLMSQYNVRPRITAEVSDMAMLRLLAREIDAVALTPRVVVQEELKNKSLVELHRVHQIQENFYAITPSRHFPNFLVKEMIQAFHCKKNGHSKDK
ncbi:MAG: LysR family transcriptional regulator [Verrucomicrobia bacterium]|nr:LysR family transcriptional regulator [Verrucomicrobiota bacterium]